MKKLILALIFGLISSAAFTTSASENDFYECTLPQADEYRVGIDISKNAAGFFDNDSTSIMKYKGSRPSSRNTENNVLIYEGKDLGGSGDLRLEFNLGTQRIKLLTLETDGTIELLGYAACELSPAWDLNEAQNN